MEKILTKKNTITGLITSERAVIVEWEDGLSSTFHHIWLRDNCPLLLDPISGQRQINPMDMPRNIHPESVTLNASNELEIVWAYDRHISQYKPEWLWEHDYTNERKKEWKPRLWDAAAGEALQAFDYEEVFSRKEVMYECLTLFRDYGFVRLFNVPEKPGTVLDIANTLSYEENAIHGRTYEVKLFSETPHLAYTNKALPFHTDDAYHNPVPSALLLHCIKNNTEGGESTLVDGFKIATAIRESAPDQFQLLSTLPVMYRFKYERSGDFSHKSPLIRLDPWGEIEHVLFSDHCLQPFRLSPDIMEDYYDAYITFSRMLMSSEFHIRFALKPGDLTMMDNRRILHGRTAFSKTGERYLQGCFIARDGLYGRLALSKQHNEQ